MSRRRLPVAYGEVGSSLYFALGIIALFALGFTPWVLLAVGLLRRRGDADERRKALGRP